MDYKNTAEFAREMDSKDELKDYRSQFYIPEVNGKESVYFTGNSLGLQPKTVRSAFETELEDWAKWGVEGHFHARNPWYSYHELFAEKEAKLVGAKAIEVVLMNTLTTNLHLLMVSFYRPQGKRTKIICEAKAFPSDQYAIESQIRFHGLDPKTNMIEVAPRENEHLIREEDILNTIEEHNDDVALVLFGGVNYYSGQVFDMKTIAQKAHEVGAVVGFDLAHAAGNIPMKLHDWNVDFACWCTYKYLNSGPGSVSGVFIHEKHAHDDSLPRFTGWWGYDKSKRFEMESGFKAIPGAEGWQLSNAPVFNMVAHKASLELFNEVGMDKLRAKSLLLTGYLEFIIQNISKELGDGGFEIITPKDPDQRGCQLSILAHGYGKGLFDELTAQGVIADWREPNVIRIAPVPMYNSFMDIYRFGEALRNALNKV